MILIFCCEMWVVGLELGLKHESIDLVLTIWKVQDAETWVL